MGEMTITTPFDVSTESLHAVHLLDRPEVLIDQGAVLKVLAVSKEPIESGDHVAMGFVATKPGRAEMLGEFSNEPTGEYKPCNAVKGFIGDEIIFDRNVSTDQPFPGLRTAIAQLRAARAVKSRLKG